MKKIYIQEVVKSSPILWENRGLRNATTTNYTIYLNSIYNSTMFLFHLSAASEIDLGSAHIPTPAQT